MNQLAIKNLIMREEREKKKKKKKRILESHQSFNNDTISAVTKISIRQIQQHQDLVYPRVDHMSSPKASEPWHLWIAHVTLSFTVCELLWCCWICLIEIFPMIPVVSLLKLWCASNIFFLCFFSFLFSL
jgi:hypothetical protein